MSDDVGFLFGFPQLRDFYLISQCISCSSRFKLVRTGFVRFLNLSQIQATATEGKKKVRQLQPQKDRTAVRSGSVAVFFRLPQPDFKTLVAKVFFKSSASLHIDTFDENLCCHQIHRSDVISLEMLP